MELQEFLQNFFLILIPKLNKEHEEETRSIDAKTPQKPDIKFDLAPHNEHWLSMMQEEGLEVMVM